MPVTPFRDHYPRSLLPPVAVLAGIVVLLAAVAAAQGIVATVAFAALAAIICRRLQLALVRRGLRGWLALTITVAAFVLVIGSLAAASVASIIALIVEIGKDTDALAARIAELAATFGYATGLPPESVPRVQVSELLSGARSLLGTLSPAVTGLLMALLIVTYLLLGADSLRERMLGATSAGTIARYDALARELWVYTRVRASLGAAAAVANTILLVMLGVPYAFLWGVVSFLFSFVPNIGFVLALMPPAILALLDGGPVPALLVVGGYVAINLAFDYVLQPRMMSAELDISPVVTIVCIMVWTFLIGATGALLAVPLTIALRAILLPFPGARWFVALLGPVPEDPADPEADPEDPADPAAVPEAAPESGREPTIGA